MKNPIRIFTMLFIAAMQLLLFHFNAVAQNAPAGRQQVSWQTIENNGYKNFASPVTYNDLCQVYSSPDTASEILSTLKFKTPIQLLRQGEEDFPDDGKGGLRFLKWYEIAYQNTKAYVKASEIATHWFANLTTDCDYFLVTDFSMESNPDTNSLIIYKYDNMSNSFKDTLAYKNFRADVAKEIDFYGWQHVNMLLHLQEINAYCGGGQTDLFIVDANNNLSELIQTSFFADDGSADSYSSQVWLPIKFKPGNILLLLNGDVENAFDTYAGKLNTHTLPKELAISKMETIVFNEVKIESIYDKNNEPIKNADDTYKSKTVINKTKYYRWNGIKLIPVKN